MTRQNTKTAKFGLRPRDLLITLVALGGRHDQRFSSLRPGRAQGAPRTVPETYRRMGDRGGPRMCRVGADQDHVTLDWDDSTGIAYRQPRLRGAAAGHAFFLGPVIRAVDCPMGIRLKPWDGSGHMRRLARVPDR